MINKDRIVPVTKTDLLTLYGVILKQDSNNSSLAKLASSDVEGDFAIASAGTYIADQPVKSVLIQEDRRNTDSYRTHWWCRS